MSDELNKIEEKLVKVLDEWASGSKDERYVHEEAEYLLATVDWKDLPRDSKDSVILEVLSQLDILNQQLIIQSDVPAFKKFLTEGHLNPLLAWSNWESYWNNVDYEERKSMLQNHSYYCV